MPENDAPETSWERFNEDINYIDVYALYARVCMANELFCERDEKCTDVLQIASQDSEESKLLAGTIRRRSLRDISLLMCVRAHDLLDFQEIAQWCGTYFLVEFSTDCGVYHWIGERELENNTNLYIFF